MFTSPDWFLEQARLGRMFHSCSTGAVTLSTVSATCTGLVVGNPYGSGKLVVIVRARFAPSTIPAGISVVGLAISPAVSATAIIHTTPAVIHNAITTGSNINVGVATVDAAATLPGAPVWFRPFAVQISGSTTTAPVYEDMTNGQVILPPGANLSFSYLTTAAVGIASFTWVEIDQNT